jgi:hypothetical protein
VLLIVVCFCNRMCPSVTFTITRFSITWGLGQRSSKKKYKPHAQYNSPGLSTFVTLFRSTRNCYYCYCFHTTLPVWLAGHAESLVEQQTKKAGKDGASDQRRREQRIVARELQFMLDYVDRCLQESNLLGDEGILHSKAGVKCILVSKSLRAIKWNWTDSTKGVYDAADEVQRDGLPRRNARTIREYYQDWRQHDCEGFSESMTGLCQEFTI